MRLKIRENLETASFNPKFTVLIKKVYSEGFHGFTAFPDFTMRTTIILLNDWL